MNVYQIESDLEKVTNENNVIKEELAEYKLLVRRLFNSKNSKDFFDSQRELKILVNR